MMEMLDFTGWVPELVATRARDGIGIDELWAAIDRHAEYLRESGELEAKRRSAFAHRVRALVMGDLERRVEARIEERMGRTNGSAADPYGAAREILADVEAALPESQTRPATRPTARASVKGL
jgi:LAO/AO transport system kinase